MKGSSTPPIRDSFTAAEIKRYQAWLGERRTSLCPPMSGRPFLSRNGTKFHQEKNRKHAQAKGNDHAHRLCL